MTSVFAAFHDRHGRAGCCFFQIEAEPKVLCLGRHHNSLVRGRPRLLAVHGMDTVSACAEEIQISALFSRWFCEARSGGWYLNCCFCCFCCWLVMLLQVFPDTWHRGIDLCYMLRVLHLCWCASVFLRNNVAGLPNHKGNEMHMASQQRCAVRVCVCESVS